MVDCDFATMGTYIFTACGDIHRMPNMLYSRNYQLKQKMEKRRVYISGKISGLDNHYVQLKFAACAESLKSVGYEPVNPLKNGLPSSASWKEHMRADIALLKTCDYIYLQRDFIMSRGAMIELFLAIRWGKPIIMSDQLANDIVFISQRKEGSPTKYDLYRFPLDHPVFLAAKIWMDNPLGDYILKDYAVNRYRAHITKMDGL